MHGTRKITYEVDENGCHICTSHTLNNSGYYTIWYNKKCYQIHRYLYSQQFGEIPQGLVVRHKCDNRQCINIDHMELGTHADNVQDRVSRNRSATGESNGRSKLTEENVRYIRQHLELGSSLLGKMFGVSRKVIWEIKNDIIWKHVI